MERKTFGRVELKDADQGIVSAVFSTFDVIDLDGDVVRKSAFNGKDGKRIPVSAYNHSTWEGAMPVGVAVVKVTGNEAIAEMQLNLKTQAGRETFETIKQMGELQEYSWGFNVTDSGHEEVEGKSVRVIKSVDIFEVSPVFLGAAGPGRTRTLAVKGTKATHGDHAEEECTEETCPEHPTEDEHEMQRRRTRREGQGKGASRAKDGSLMDDERGRRLAVRGPIPYTETDTITRSWDGAKTVKALPEDARPSQLRTVFAWVDPDGDPEEKSSYAFAHHHGIGGQANIRACLQGIAKLNSDDPGIPEADREAVYKHLSAHLLDADREPTKLRTAESEKGRKRFNDEAIEVMAAVSSLIDRASEVVALRAQKNRGMAPATADLLSWLEGDLVRLKSLLETPVDEERPAGPSEEEIAAAFMAAVARLNGI